MPEVDPELDRLLTWYYEGRDKGELPPFEEVMRDVRSTGRNEPCPCCDSGKKFKKCCGRLFQ